jgi:hypothetical protein
MNKISAFINNMDSAAWRTIWVSLALLVGVVAIIVIASRHRLCRSHGRRADIACARVHGAFPW